MTLLLLAIVGIGVALAIAIFGLLYLVAHRRQTTASRTQSNVAIHQQNREVLIDFAEQDDQDSLQAESDIALLRDVDSEDESTEVGGFNKHILTVVLVVSLSAIFLYWFLWGRPGTLLLQEAADLMALDTTPEIVREVESLLRSYSEMHPSDAVIWHRLLTFQWFLDNRESFRATFAEATSHEFQSAYTDSLYLLDAFSQRQMNFIEEDRRVLSRLRESGPSSPVLSLIDALDHSARGEYRESNLAWEQILSRPDEFRIHDMARLGQNRTRAVLLPESSPRIRVEVVLNDIHAEKRWLFISARSEHVPTPLVVVKRPLTRERRYEVVLDDSLSMLRSNSLVDAEVVLVQARLTSSEDALRQAGDETLLSELVSPSEHPRVRLIYGEKEPILDGQLPPDLVMGPSDQLFIIVRKLDVSNTPVAMRRFIGPMPHDGIQVEVADITDSQATIDRSQRMQVVSRLVPSQSSSTSLLDRPGSTQEFNWGETVVLDPIIVGTQPNTPLDAE